MSKILFFFIILLSFNIQGKEFNNFSVDGINIKESLLNYTSRSNIKNEIANNWDWYEDVGIDNKFVEVFFWSKNSKFENVSFFIKPDDPNFIVYGISGTSDIEFDKCLSLQNLTHEDFLTYSNIDFDYSIEDKHPSDPTGKSYYKSIYFDVSNNNYQIEINCTDFDKSMQRDGNNQDYFGIYAVSPEIIEWFVRKEE